MDASANNSESTFTQNNPQLLANFQFTAEDCPGPHEVETIRIFEIPNRLGFRLIFRPSAGTTISLATLKWEPLTTAQGPPQQTHIG